MTTKAALTYLVRTFGVGIGTYPLGMPTPRRDTDTSEPYPPRKGPFTRDTYPRRDLGAKIPTSLCEQTGVCECITFSQLHWRALTKYPSTTFNMPLLMDCGIPMKV